MGLAQRIGQRLSRLRALTGDSQESLAAQVGCTRSNIASIETGRGTPSLDLAIEIAAYFRVPIQSLYSDDDEQFAAMLTELAKARRFLETTTDLPEPVISALLDLAKEVQTTLRG